MAVTPVAHSFAWQGIRNALLLPAWIVGFSLVGVGSLARDAGHPIGAAILSTILVWASPAQLILYGSLAGGGLVTAAGIAVGLSAIRLLPMTLAILPYLKRPGQTFLTQALLAHLVAATSWIEGMRRLQELPVDSRVPYFVGFGTTCLAVSAVMTGAGYLLVSALPPALAAGLLGLTPIYFTISLAGGARIPADWAAIGLGLGLAPVAQVLIGREYDLLATGLVGGTVAYLVGRMTSGGRPRSAGPSAGARSG